jgi:transposase-like protein
MSTAAVNGKQKRRRLSASEKYEIFVSVLTGQATEREAAEQYRVDRSTVVTACRVAEQGALDALAAAVPGRPGSVASRRWRTPGPRSSGCARRSPNRRWRCTCTREKRVGTDRRPGPCAVEAPVKAGLLAPPGPHRRPSRPAAAPRPRRVR